VYSSTNITVIKSRNITVLGCHWRRRPSSCEYVE